MKNGYVNRRKYAVSNNLTEFSQPLILQDNSVKGASE